MIIFLLLYYLFPFNSLNDTQFLLLINGNMDKASDDLKLYPDDPFSHFINSSDALDLNSDFNDDDDDIFNQITSKYYNT